MYDRVWKPVHQVNYYLIPILYFLENFKGSAFKKEAS